MTHASLSFQKQVHGYSSLKVAILFAILSFLSVPHAASAAPGVNTPDGQTDLQIAVQGAVGLDLDTHSGLPGTVPDATIPGNLTVNKNLTIGIAPTAGTINSTGATAVQTLQTCPRGQTVTANGDGTFSCAVPGNFGGSYVTYITSEAGCCGDTLVGTTVIGQGCHMTNPVTGGCNCDTANGFTAIGTAPTSSLIEKYITHPHHYAMTVNPNLAGYEQVSYQLGNISTHLRPTLASCGGGCSTGTTYTTFVCVYGTSTTNPLSWH